MSSNVPANLRYKKTLAFLEKHVAKSEKIVDLGTPNLLSQAMKEKGYSVINTGGEDFDVDFIQVAENYPADCYTSFEVFEHLLAPYNLLKEIKQGKLICSVPLKVWFAKAYWNKDVEWDRHYHEFEPRQFDWLLEKTGWEIKAREKWASPDDLRFGIRPLLRFFYPSFYFVYAIKKL
jgi:hypothetical protein